MIKRPGLANVPEVDSPWLHDFKALTYTSGDKSLNYRLFSPNEDHGEPLPLVLWLHGAYGRGNHNQKQLFYGYNGFGPAFFSDPERQKEFPCYVLAPQCPGGKLWIKFRNNTSTRYLRWVMDLMDELVETHSIDRNRIYVTGQSMGGFATWVLLAEYPGRFAGAVPICGGAPLRKLKKRLETPVWAFHGDKDRLVRPWRTRKAVEAARTRPVEVKYTHFPEERHFIGPKVFSEPELDEWLFSHARS